MKNFFLFWLWQALPYFLFAQFNQPLKLSLSKGNLEVYPINVGKQGLLLLTQTSVSHWKLTSYDSNFRQKWENSIPEMVDYFWAGSFFDGEKNAYFLLQNKLKIKLLKQNLQDLPLELSEFVLPLPLQIKQFYWLGDVGIATGKLEDGQNLLLKLQSGENKAQIISIFPQNDWDLEKLAFDTGYEQVLIHLKNKKIRQQKTKIFSPRLGMRELNEIETKRLTTLPKTVDFAKYAEENPYILLPQMEGLVLAFAHPDPETTAMYISSKFLQNENSWLNAEKQNLSKLTDNQINSTYFWRLEVWNERDILLIGRKQFTDLSKPVYAIYKLSYSLKDETMGKRLKD
jgi:hypothetical protein